MAFQFKSFQQILSDMIGKIISSSPLNDVHAGSVLSTLLEAAAQEDFQQYYQMLQIIRNYSLDTTEGDDLDNRAAEYKLVRNAAQKASGLVTISDSALTKISTKIYAGLSGPVSGQTYIYVDDASTFPATGTIIIGRSTINVETITYTAITNFINYYKLQLGAPLANDHGTDETIVLSQGGDRVIPAGTIVKIPVSDISDEIKFSVVSTYTIVDGEQQLENIEVMALDAGTVGNAPVGSIIEFDTLPFATAQVTNPASFTNGANVESDAELRDRIKIYIQSLSRGTKSSIINAAIGAVDVTENKRVVSANLIDATDLNDLAKLYIDDGTGFEPSFAGHGGELVVDVATGGEQFLQLDLFPLVKAQLETLNAEPFNVIGGQTLQVKVDYIEETLTFAVSDFAIVSAATAEEVVTAINDRAIRFEARTSQNGTKIVLSARSNANETIQVSGGTALGASKLNFPTDKRETLYLYKQDATTVQLLNKDGGTAYLECSNSAPYDFTGAPLTLTIVVDGKTANTQTITFVAGDFNIITVATAAEVAARLNAELSGATAILTNNNTRVTLVSNLDNSAGSKIEVTGGPANAILGFAPGEVAGRDKDYTLNRFNGQIELENALVAGESITAGSIQTRSFVITLSQPFDLDNGDTIDFIVDGGGAQTVTFNNADFANIDAALSAEVAAVFNRDLNGIIATVTSENRVKVTTNTFANTGTIKVNNFVGVSGDALGLQSNVLFSNLNPHTAFIQSSSAQPYALTVGQNLIVIMDNDAVNKTFNITMNLNGRAHTIGAPNTQKFRANILIGGSSIGDYNTKFLINDILKDFTVTFTSGANIGVTRAVTAYDASNGEFTCVAFANPIVVTDEFYILPITAKNVCTFLSNTVTSTLNIEADIVPSANGTKIQISSKEEGSAGQVHVTGGTANAILNFSITAGQGIDAYKYYTGLLRTVQYIVDGLDSDASSYPGYKAAGVQVEVSAPTVRHVTFIIDVTLIAGVSINAVVDEIKSKVSAYVNGLGVGQDVILSEIISAIMAVDSVADVEIITPSANIAIADNELARVSDTEIVIG